jgi:hypothetical protein
MLQRDLAGDLQKARTTREHGSLGFGGGGIQKCTCAHGSFDRRDVSADTRLGGAVLAHGPWSCEDSRWSLDLFGANRPSYTPTGCSS